MMRLIVDKYGIIWKIIAVIGVLTSILAIAIIISFVTLIFMKKNEVNKDMERFSYRYRRINPGQRHSSSSFVHIPKRIDDEGSIFYEEIDGTFVLISDFGTTEYECTGSCVCLEESDESGQERRTSSAIASGMIYFVAALSSIVAIDRAKDYFEDECSKRIGDECSFDHIHSSVEDCLEIDEKDLLDVRDVDVVASKILNFTGHSIYRCYGKCFRVDFTKKNLGFDPEHNWYYTEIPQVEKAYKECYKTFVEERKGECKDLFLEKEMLQAPDWSLEGLKISFIFAELRYFCERSSLFPVFYKFLADDPYGDESGPSIPSYMCTSVDQDVLIEIVEQNQKGDSSNEEDMTEFILDLVDMGIILETHLDKDVNKKVWNPAFLNPSVECVYSREYDRSKVFSKNFPPR